LVFSLPLLVNSTGTAPDYALSNGYNGDQAYPIMFDMAGFELAGVAVLLKLTL
jgi:hypothetical protein